MGCVKFSPYCCCKETLFATSRVANFLTWKLFISAEFGNENSPRNFQTINVVEFWILTWMKMWYPWSWNCWSSWSKLCFWNFPKLKYGNPDIMRRKSSKDWRITFKGLNHIQVGENNFKLGRYYLKMVNDLQIFNRNS